MKVRRRIYYLFSAAKDKNKAGTIYDYVMMAIISLSILPLCVRNPGSFMQGIDRGTAYIFLIDYILRWITYDYKKPKLKKKAFVYYPVSPFGIIDLLSILPVFTSLNASFRILRLFRLIRALKVFKILRYSKSFFIIVTILKKQKDALLSVCYLAIGYILVSALIMFAVEPEYFETFFRAIYWATTALTTVGYGDVYPQSDIGKIVSMFSSVMGIAIVALPSGIITAGYMDELGKKKN